MNENLELELLDEIVDFNGEGENPFMIDDDNKANWAMKKIKLMQQEKDRKLRMADYAISEYEMKKEQINKEFEDKTTYFRTQLQQYFESVPKKSTKTKDSYVLLHGELVRSKNKIEYVRDKVLLTGWLKRNKMNEYIEIKEEPKWGELKKVTKVLGDKVVTTDGELIEGVTAIVKPDEFEVKLEK